MSSTECPAKQRTRMAVDERTFTTTVKLHGVSESASRNISRSIYQKPSVQKTSVFYDHVQKEHFGTNPTVKLEILAQFHGNAAMRQAAEAVTIRDEKPPLNGKEENTNQPRKRRDRNRNAVSDVN